MTESGVAGPVEPLAAPGTQSQTRKFLVVKASFFALTTRIDSNVRFWGPKETTQSAVIPVGITDIWFSRREISGGIRTNLVRQAIERGLRIHHLSIKLLIEELIDVWADPRHRSLMKPAEDDDAPGINEVALPMGESSLPMTMDSALALAQAGPATDDDERLTPEEDAEDEATMERRIQLLAAKLTAGSAVARKKVEGLKRLKAAHRAHKKRASKAKQQAQPAVAKQAAAKKVLAAEVVIQKSAVVDGWAAKLEILPVVERRLFEDRYGVGKKSGQSVHPAKVGKAYGMDEPTAQRVIDRAWSRLRDAGLRLSEAQLLSGKPGSA